MTPQAPSGEERERLARLRRIVDATADRIRYGNLTVEEASRLIDETRSKVLALFPDKEETYDLIYKPRFYRLVVESFGGKVP